MGFGIGSHAHVDAAAFSVLLTALTGVAKWLLGFRFPDHILGLPRFLAVFVAYYLILYIVFLVSWSRK